MARNVLAVTCPRCETKYKTKVKKGRHSRKCPGCSESTEEATRKNAEE